MAFLGFQVPGLVFLWGTPQGQTCRTIASVSVAIAAQAPRPNRASEWQASAASPTRGSTSDSYPAGTGPAPLSNLASATWRQTLTPIQSGVSGGLGWAEVGLWGMACDCSGLPAAITAQGGPEQSRLPQAHPGSPRVPRWAWKQPVLTSRAAWIWTNGPA